MEPLKPRVNVFKEENDLSNLTLGPSLGDSITQVWPEIERLSHIFAITPFTCMCKVIGLDQKMKILESYLILIFGSAS